jgi:hypothetical protein
MIDHTEAEVEEAPIKMVDAILSVRKYKAGYEIRTELLNEDFACGVGVTMKTAYTIDGNYIGDPKWAYHLYKRGIKPERINSSHRVCSIGFCEKEQKWYGWSHRAMYGFGIGDVVEEGDCCASSGWTLDYLAEHPEEDLSLPVGFEAKTIEDAKRMAIAFAESVS